TAVIVVFNYPGDKIPVNVYSPFQLPANGRNNNQIGFFNVFKQGIGTHGKKPFVVFYLAGQPYKLNIKNRGMPGSLKKIVCTGKNGSGIYYAGHYSLVRHQYRYMYHNSFFCLVKRKGGSD